MRGCNAGKHALDSLRIPTIELVIAQIDLVHHLGDLQQRRIVERKAVKQRFEGAAIAFVRELRLEHVEAQLALLRPIAFRSDELEPRLGIDEAPDEPRARDAVDEDSFTRHPNAVLHLPARARRR